LPTISEVEEALRTIDITQAFTFSAAKALQLTHGREDGLSRYLGLDGKAAE
jgi:hypothetical protein